MSGLEEEREERDARELRGSARSTSTVAAATYSGVHVRFEHDPREVHRQRRELGDDGDVHVRGDLRTTVHRV